MGIDVAGTIKKWQRRYGEILRRILLLAHVWKHRNCSMLWQAKGQTECNSMLYASFFFFSVSCGKYVIVFRVIAIYLHLSILALVNALVSFYSHVNVWMYRFYSVPSSRWWYSLFLCVVRLQEFALIFTSIHIVSDYNRASSASDVGAQCFGWFGLLLHPWGRGLRQPNRRRCAGPLRISDFFGGQT